MNLTTNTYWSPVIYWNDAMRSVSAWDNRIPADLPLDSDGWPTSLVSASSPTPTIYAQMLVLSNKGNYLTGDYVLTWEGTGNVTLRANGAGATAVQLITDTPGRRVYRVLDKTATGFYVRIVSTNDAPNHVRGIKLWMPGKENSTALIHETVAAEHSKLKVLRMMDWGETNNSTVVSWSDRPKLNGPIKDPVPYETMVAVSNELNKDIWICVPHLANDDFITQLATYIRDNLNPGLRCWVEYSNEVWNGNFKQTNWVNNLSGFPGANLNEKYAYRAGQVFTLFNSVFGSQASSRLQRICAGQTGDSSRAQKRLAGLNGNVDALAIAYYVGSGETTVNQWIIDNWNNGALTYAQFRDYLKNVEIDQRRAPQWQNNLNHANTYGVPMVAYEGGQHLVDKTNGVLTQAQKDFMVAFQRTSEMGEVIRYTLDRWTQIGGRTAVAFNNYYTPSAYPGSWGHREYSGQPLAEAPKWAAFDAWIDANGDITAPVLTLPSNITAEATSSAGATVTFAVSATDAVSGSITPVASPASGSVFPLGNTTVNVTATDAAGNVASGSFAVSVVDTVSPTATVSASVTTAAAPASLTLTSTASDSASGVAKVQFYQNGSLIGEDSSSPYSFSVTNLGVGAWSFTAQAVDASGNTGTSTAVTVSVDNLTEYGYTATARGTGSSGYGAVTASDGTLLVKGSGNGFSASGDSYYEVADTQTSSGNFQAIARIKSITGTGKVGLIIRETNDASTSPANTARFVEIGAAPGSSTYTYSSRSTSGTAPVSGTATVPTGHTPPSKWLMLERIEDVIKVAVSTDGSAFTEVERVRLDSLSQSLKVALYATGTGPVEAVFDIDGVTLAPEVVGLGADVTSGLVGRWKFNEGTGTTAADSRPSGTANDATLSSGATWSNSGKLDRALSLNGTSHAQAADSADYHGSALTISAWVNSNTNDSTVRAIVSKRVSSTSEYAFALYTETGSSILRYKIGSATVVSTGISLGTGWRHVVLVFDGSLSTNRVKIYMDGNATPAYQGNPGTVTTIPDTTAPLCIGKLNSSFATGFNGLIDDVRIYNRALSSSEVVQLNAYGY